MYGIVGNRNERLVELIWKGNAELQWATAALVARSAS